MSPKNSGYPGYVDQIGVVLDHRWNQGDGNPVLLWRIDLHSYQYDRSNRIWEFQIGYDGNYY